MTTVVLSPFDVVGFPEGGGHFWVYMQYAQGLRRLGCDVYWLEQVRRRKDPDRDAHALATFRERLERFGMGQRVLLYTLGEDGGPIGDPDVSLAQAEAGLRRAGLIPKFPHAIVPRDLSSARRTAPADLGPRP